MSEEFKRGQEIVLNEMFNAIAELEAKTPDTGNGKAKKRAWRELIDAMCGEGIDLKISGKDGE